MWPTPGNILNGKSKNNQRIVPDKSLFLEIKDESGEINIVKYDNVVKR